MRNTHELESAEGVTGQDTERKQARGTRSLESVESVSQDTERKQTSEEYSLSEERKGTDMSGHGKRASE
jgi:hypothetical protein